MIIALDASAGIEIALSRPLADHFRGYISSCRKVITTDLYKAEVTNTLWKYVAAGYLSKSKGVELLQLTYELVDEYHDMDENCIEAFNESIRLNHTAYDMFYFTLARRTGALLLSCDKGLLELAVQEGVDHL